MNIKAPNYKNIFKSDLEADMMLQIFQTYLDSATDVSFWEKNADYLTDVLTEIQGVSSFELSCDFLMDEEKDVIKLLVNALD